MYEDYENLIERLRECTAEQNGEKTLWCQAADAIDNLLYICKHQAEELRNISKWVSVEERLPEKGIDVLVFAEGKVEGFFGDTVIAISNRYDFKIFTDFEEVEVWRSPWQYFLTDYEITHWMPLPEPPKEET